MSDPRAKPMPVSDSASDAEPGWIGTSREFLWLQAIVKTILILNMFDAVMTIMWVSAGSAVEANPFIAGLVSDNPLNFVLVKLALVSLGSLLLWRNRRHPLAVVAIFVAFLAYYFLLLYHLRALRVALVAWINT